MHPELDDTRNGGDRLILILDPDPRIGEALTLALRRRARVERVGAALAGLLIIAERGADLVLAQAHLPDMHSGDLLRLIHQLSPGLPVALVGMDPPPAGSPGPRADAYFPEPFQLKRVLGWIDDCLDRPITEKGGPFVTSPPVHYEIPGRHLEIVRWVLEFTERHHQEGIRLATIARTAGVSRSHLCRVFKRVTGLSVKRVLTRRRLQAAKELLQEPDATIEQVARRAGFRDASHLDRVFQHWEGVPPSAYRRRMSLRSLRNRVPPLWRNFHSPSSFHSSI
jgi:AraC-like DNA-binding protein